MEDHTVAMSIRVFLLDDHEVVRRGLRERLESAGDIEVCREVRSRHLEVACITLTSFGDDAAVYAAIVAGESGDVFEQVRDTELVDGIRRMASGDSLLDPCVTTRLLAHENHSNDARPSR